MESRNYIESAVIFGIKSLADLKKLRFNSGDFAIFGTAFDFANDYFDEYGKFPPESLLKERFSDLDETSVGVDLDYSLDEFRKQIVQRKAQKILRANEENLREDPEKAVKEIVSSFEDLEVLHDTDIHVYDAGETNRLSEYRHRKETRLKMRIIGIPTPFRTINTTGVGWSPGDLVSFFAATGVGKTWMCLKIAAIAMRRGHKVLFLSGEMPADQIMLRMDVVMGNMVGHEFSHKALRRGEDIDEEKYKTFLEEMSGRNMFVCNHVKNQALTFTNISMLIRKHKPDILVLDAAEFIGMTTRTKGDAVWEGLHQLYYGLKVVAVNNNIPCIVSTQANTSSPTAKVHRSDVAYGRALIRSSDICFSMYLDEDDTSHMIVQMQKVRNDEVPPFPIFMDWDANIGLIQELS